jgi:ubiquinone/menaquinone biosynthesis C-methylase UbiE
LFFNLLYHPFAFSYDLVAAGVSFGQWKNWVSSIVPFIEGTRVLELGHGPGHLQRILLDQGLSPAAMDESAQMGYLAKRRLGRSQKLTRGLAQQIPFASDTFDSIVSTFPTDYIFDTHTLSETHRVLRKGGRLTILLSAWPKNSLLAWLFKVTGQSPGSAYQLMEYKITEILSHTKFDSEVKLVEVKSSNLLFVIARKED